MTTYLNKKVKYFQAGSISNQLFEWEKLTSDKEVLSTVCGMPLEFNDSTF